MKIKKAVFPVAGFGTRFLPATKSTPKEMLPVVDKPLIQYAVEEAAEIGVKEFIFITHHAKSSIDQHFKKNESLFNMLINQGKEDLANSIKDIGLLHPITVSKKDNFFYLISGNHRLHSFKYLQRTEIPATINGGNKLVDKLIALT